MRFIRIPAGEEASSAFAFCCKVAIFVSSDIKQALSSLSSILPSSGDYGQGQSLFVLLSPAQPKAWTKHSLLQKLITALGSSEGLRQIFRVYSGRRVNGESDTNILTEGLFSHNLTFFTMTYSDFKFTLCLKTIKRSCRV